MMINTFLGTMFFGQNKVMVDANNRNHPEHDLYFDISWVYEFMHILPRHLGIVWNKSEWFKIWKMSSCEGQVVLEYCAIADKVSEPLHTMG